MSKITLLNYTPIEVLIKATAMPYQSKETKGLVKRVFDSGHKSVVRHGMASFLIEDVSQSLLRQISRHPMLNLTVKSSRYCDMTDVELYIPSTLKVKARIKLMEEYIADQKIIADLYIKWRKIEADEGLKDISKLFLSLASTTDLVVSGNYQAWYEFLQLRNCTRVEAEFREISLEMTKILKGVMPEIFSNLGCKGDELGYCPEIHDSCKKYPQKGKVI